MGEHRDLLPLAVGERVGVRGAPSSHIQDQNPSPHPSPDGRGSHVLHAHQANEIAMPPAARGKGKRWVSRLRAVALGAGFPHLLIFLWDRAVALTGTRLV